MTLRLGRKPYGEINTNERAFLTDSKYVRFRQLAQQGLLVGIVAMSVGCCNRDDHRTRTFFTKTNCYSCLGVCW